MAGNSEYAPRSGYTQHSTTGLMDFNKKSSVNIYCHKLIALPLLPNEQIAGAFFKLKELEVINQVSLSPVPM